MALRTANVYWYGTKVLYIGIVHCILFNGIVYWYCDLVLGISFVQLYCVLVLCFGFVCRSSVLLVCIGDVCFGCVY